MPQQSQEGLVGFRTQASPATFVSPGGAGASGRPHAGHFMKTRGGALVANRELIIPDPEIGGNRDTPDAVLGPVSYSGEYEAYLRFDAIGPLLKGALGAVSSSAVGTTWNTDVVGTHTITPSDNALTLPLLSVEEGIGASWENFRYTDAVVNTLHIESAPDGYVMFNAGLIAKTQLAGASRTANPVFDNSPLVVGSNVAVEWNGASVCAKEFSFDFNNNIEDDDFCLGSNTLQNLVPKRREITAGFSVRDDDSTDYWREAVYGSASATGPQAGVSVKRELVVTITAGSNIGSTSTPYSLALTFPYATIKPFEVSPSGDDVIENAFEIQIFRPDPAEPAVTMELVNRYPTIL